LLMAKEIFFLLTWSLFSISWLNIILLLRIDVC
jgi:hypothetical protein